MSESSHQNRERQSDLAVLDANEYKQKRRLERILDAHDNVEDAAAEARAMYFSGEINQHAHNIIVQEAVKRAIRENLNLLLDYAANSGDEAYFWDGDVNDPLGRINRKHSKDIIIVGLADFLESDWFYYDEWTTRERPRNRPARAVEHSTELTMPRNISWYAYRRLKRFLQSEHDLEIQFEWLEDKRPFHDWGEDDDADAEVSANGV